MVYLATRLGRFLYAYTLSYGSWLNLIECTFSKMACTFLRQIRIASMQEPEDHILRGIDEFNEPPVRLPEHPAFPEP